MVVNLMKMCWKRFNGRYLIVACCLIVCVYVVRMHFEVLHGTRHGTDTSKTIGVITAKKALQYTDRKVEEPPVFKVMKPAAKKDTADPAKLNFTAVMIVAYMRSGSTFLGNIIQHDPSVFYVFEPLRQIVKDFESTMTGVFGDKLSFEKRRPSMMTRQECLQIYRAWLTCDIQRILEVRHRFYWPFFTLGHKTNALLRCLNLTEENSQNFTIDSRCVRDVQKLCVESKVRVIKTVRTPMDWLYDLMGEFPNMKIIHLVRDPRAIANSYKGFENCHSRYEPNAYLKCLQYMCGRIEDDLFPYEIYSRQFSGRMSRLYFEDFANMTENLSEKIYQWLGLTFTQRTKQYIHNITQTGLKPKSELDTVRPNSKDVISAWRKELHPSYVYTVESLCVYSMKRLMYPPSK